MNGTSRQRKLCIDWVLARPNMSGGTKSNRLIAEAMVRRGHQVNLVYLASRRPWPSLLRVRSLMRRLGGEIRVRCKQKHHLESSTANLIPVDRDHIRVEDVPDADVCIASWWRMRQMIEAWPASKGIKVHLIRGYEVWGDDPQGVKEVYRLAGQKVVISRWLQRVMAEEFGDPHAVLVPNGVDRLQFDSTPRRRAVVPTVGLLYGAQPIKGADTAFTSLRLVQERMPNVRVVAFGSSPIIRDHRPPDNFKYYLRPDQALIPKLYRSADCWLLPSMTEGFGMPGLEAAACRCPIISTRFGGPEDFVEDGVTGRLVPVGDARAMADAVLEILNFNEGQWRAMSEASYGISLNFDWDRSADKLERALLAATGDQTSSALQCDPA